VARIGFLSSGSAATDSASLPGLRRGLQDLGYIEGQDIVIEPRYAEGHYARVPGLAAELVQLHVELIVTVGPLTPQAAREARRTIPIVAVYPRDPVADGLVASLAQPGGNVTGLTSFAAHLTAKRLELLKETLPGVSRVAVLFARDESDQLTLPERNQPVAQALGMHLLPFEVRAPDEIDAAIGAATQEGAEALFVTGQPVISVQRSRVVALAAEHRLPAMYVLQEFVREGGLMSYAPNGAAQTWRAATFVDKILKGAKPADLPVEQPMRFDFIINARNAQALGLTIPHHVLLQATEVIQ
jgi:putative ABC transport system substrate-binding protein